jgi:hypothetical protein
MNPHPDTKAPRPLAGPELRTALVELRRVTFAGGVELWLDDGTVVRPARQGWTPARSLPALFEGALHAPSLTVELALATRLDMPARMTLRGEADNGMVFQREFTLPAGRCSRRVSDIPAGRGSQGRFDMIESLRWSLSSPDTAAQIESGAEMRVRAYFVPRREAEDPPYETLLFTLCRLLRGSLAAGPESLARLWEGFEPLDLPCADGRSRLRPVRAGEIPVRGRLAALLKHRRGGTAAWLEMFQACLRMAGCRPGTTALPNPQGERPWTVDDIALKTRLLAARLRQAARSSPVEPAGGKA